MPRALIFFVCVLQLTNNGFALKCFKCSSLHDDGCDDNFNYNPAFMFDCTEDPMMNLTSVQHCRLIKYWENDTWIIDRDCNQKDNISNVDDAEAYLCNCDYCNSSAKLNSFAWFILLFLLNVILSIFLI